MLSSRRRLAIYEDLSSDVCDRLRSPGPRGMEEITDGRQNHSAYMCGMRTDARRAIFVRTAGSPRRPRYRKPGCNATLPRAASSSRAISHRRSSISPHHFVPELLYSGTPGTIRAVGHGTRIVIEMTMHPMGYLFPSWECREYVRSAFDPCVRSLGFAGGRRRRVCRALLIVAVCWIAFAGEASTARGAGSSAPLVARRKTPERGGYAFCSDDHAESPINIRHLALSENPSG